MSIAEYRKSIRATHATGQATEHSYRPALQQLLTDLGDSDVEAINEPTQADYGAPDFIVELRQVPIGHVECKDIGTHSDTEEEGEQLKRYRNALPNLQVLDEDAANAPALAGLLASYRMEISGDSEQYTLGDGERLGVFLTNSLTEAHEDASGPMFAAEIVREAREADAVKRDHPVMVVIGNPPYSGHSANTGKWISDLMRGRIADDPHSYFSVDGEPLDERNPKWLNDNYVKFIRFAQRRINQTGEGVLGFVTNHRGETPPHSLRRVACRNTGPAHRGCRAAQAASALRRALLRSPTARTGATARSATSGPPHSEVRPRAVGQGADGSDRNE